MTQTFEHISVMPREILELVPVDNDGPHNVIDCTTGGGGHLAMLLDEFESKGTKAVALDQDDDALAFLREKFAERIHNGTVIIEKCNFGSLSDICNKHLLEGKVDYIYADLGVSSHQLDTGERGFSIHTEAPLDMRMDTTQELTAHHIVNNWDEEQIADTIYNFGEEPKSRYIARAIVERRNIKPIETTTELAELVKGAVRYNKKSKRHPAVKTFQAIRIAVNRELDQLSKLLDSSFGALRVGGRLAIITFHSLEDRLVKKKFKALAGKGHKPEPRAERHLPINSKSNDIVRGKIIKPFPMVPSEAEINLNRRSRSAKLRVIEKLQ